MQSVIHRSRLHALVAVLAVAVALVALPTPVVAQSAPRIESVHLRVTVETTSDWTTAALTPGGATASRVISQTSNASVQINGTAVGVQSSGGYAQAVVDLVFVQLTDAQTFTLAVTKGWVGQTRVRVTRIGAGGTQIANVLNKMQSSTDPTNRQAWTRTREQVLGSTLLELPHADSRRLVLAFYYPWFDTYTDPLLTDRPSQPRSTYRYADVLSMTQQARGAGVDGFVVSWAGAAANGTGFDRALDAAEATGGTVTGYLEVAHAVQAAGGNATVATATLRIWLNELLARSNRAGFLKAYDEPVIFAFGATALPAASWQLLLSEFRAAGRPIRVVGDTTDTAYAPLLWGEHDYSALGSAAERERGSRNRTLRLRSAAQLDAAAPARLSVATVAPGYDDHLVRNTNPVVPRGANGERYAETWAAAVAGDPDWVVITSWNEWFEGTSIEPSTAHGDRALQQTFQLIDAWR